MKNLFISLVAFLFVASSCEDEILINTDFEEEYVLNCVMDADSQEHIAILSRTYAIEGFNPNENTEDKFIGGAEIMLKVGSNEYTFKDSTSDRIDTMRYKEPVKFYYTKNVRRLIETEVKITAKLPNGVELNAFTSVPERIQFDYAKSDNLVPPSEEAKSFSITWKMNSFDKLFYDPRLKIVYFVEEDGVQTRYEKKVPIKYNEVGNQMVPAFRSPSYRKTIEYSIDALNNSMEEISFGEIDKSKYIIYRLELEVLTYDKFLTSYYVGTHFLDRFSIRLDEVDYSNVDGGLGIFGVYIRANFELALDSKYIRSFGYERKLLNN